MLHPKTILIEYIMKVQPHEPLFFIPFFNTLALLSRSLPVVTQIRGHIAGPPPPPDYGTCLHFIARRIQHSLPSSTRVELNHFFFFFRTHLLSSFWTSRGHRCRPFFPPVLAFNFIAHRVQQSPCSSIVHRVLLTHALAFSASQFERTKKSPRIYTSLHWGGFELTKLTYTRLEDNLIRHRGDRLQCPYHGLGT